MLDLISFLTQIPVRKNVKIEDVKAKSYLFPFVGVLIGFVVALVAFVAFGLLGATTEIAALLTLLALYLVTGLLHLDGLADFFDGLMTPGGREDKRRAMKDNNIGIAGLFAVVIVLLLTLVAIKAVGADLTAAAGFTFDFGSLYGFAGVFVIAEVAAKLSMYTCLILGKGSRSAEGLGSQFIQSASPLNYLVALLSAVIIAVLFTFSFRFVLVFTGVIIAFVVSSIAKRKVGAVSGDVVGASNELARCATLLIVAVLQIGL
ncbi:MAG TPA: adenosylcobinamide-GDP ribazoletransferase [Desulfobacteria bacterium]|nr:adenosylcobinamide-GDP ribazoletransferase [Desulfobacteria bacterium]